MKLGRKILTALFTFEVTLATTAYIVIFGLLLSDVVLRELGAGSLWGAQRISVYLMIMVGFLGLGLASAKGKHLRPRFMDWVFAGSLEPIVDRVGSAIMAGVFIWFGFISLEFLKESIEYEELARIIKMPIWYIQVVVPFAFFSTASRYVIYAISPELKPQEELE